MCLYFLSQLGSGHSIVGGDVGGPPLDVSRFVGVVVVIVVEDVVDRETASLPETVGVEVEAAEEDEEEDNKVTGVEIGGEFESLFRPFPVLFPALFPAPRPRFPLLPFLTGEAATLLAALSAAPLRWPLALLALEVGAVSALAAPALVELAS